MKVEHLRSYYRGSRVVIEMDSYCAMCWNWGSGNWLWTANKSEFKHPSMTLRDALYYASHAVEDPIVRKWLMPIQKNKH